MTQREAWRIVGEMFERFAATGEGKVGQYGVDLTKQGICFAIDYLPYLTRQDRYVMLARLDDERDIYVHWWPAGDRSAAYERALFCYFMVEASRS